jgi:protein required for attachment to host cells
MEVMTTTMFVVADRTCARFLAESGSRLDVIAEIEHPEGKLRNIDRDADRPGRTHDATGTRHAYERAESAQERITAQFARRLAKRIGALRTEHRYDELVLVAEPGLLGILRDALDAPTAKTVRRTIGKDLVHVPIHELPGRLAAG